MNFEQILLLYLYREKKVTLQEFGTIELTAQVPDPDLLKKEKQLPVEGLKFHYDRYAVTDKEFIQFYAEQKARIISLATSDIDIHLVQAKQIVNIGNPYDIPGIGKILKNDNGTLGMIPGYYTAPPAPGSGRPATLRERDKQPAIPPATEAALDGGMRRLRREKIKIYSLLVGAVLLVGAAIWAFVVYVLPAITEDSNTMVAETVMPNAPDTTTSATAPPQAPDSTTVPVPGAANQILWKAYIRRFTNAGLANEVMNKYKSYGMNAVLETKDTNDLRIYIPIQAALSDTAFKRDSLRKWFARPVTLERMAP